MVYKVDRLSRSLSDFAQMVQILDAHQFSFVSITQQFNTTTSMGRLTLNMLLSFAQFEREVIGEHVRDKVAASKQKGMWMGGIPPLGYDVVARKLVINPEEAHLVQKIFANYAAQQSLNALAQNLNAQGHHNKRWITTNGTVCGGQPFTNQALSKILNNPAYLGRTRHRDKIYEGQHEAIISQEFWDRVQALLKQNLVRKKAAAKASENASTTLLLSGKCVDENGHPFTTTYTIKRKTKRYHYYLQKTTNRRIRATELESAVVQMLSALSNHHELWHQPPLSTQSKQQWKVLWECWKSLPRDTQIQLMQQLIDQVIIAPEKLAVQLRCEAIDAVLCSESVQHWMRNILLNPAHSPKRSKSQRTQQESVFSGNILTNQIVPEITLDGESIHLSAPVTLTTKNRRQQASAASSKPLHTTSNPNPVLLKALARSNRWNQLLDARKTTITAIAKETKLGRPYVSRIINLKFLAPDIVEAILDGVQPRGLQLKQLMCGLPVEWVRQRGVLTQ